MCMRIVSFCVCAIVWVKTLVETFAFGYVTSGTEAKSAVVIFRKQKNSMAYTKTVNVPATHTENSVLNFM